MGLRKQVRKKKEVIRIIRKDSNKEDYTFVNYNILNNVNNIKDGKSATTNNEKKFGNKADDGSKKKIHSKKELQKGRKILGKSL